MKNFLKTIYNIFLFISAMLGACMLCTVEIGPLNPDFTKAQQILATDLLSYGQAFLSITLGLMLYDNLKLK